MVNMKKWLSLFAISRKGRIWKESWDCDQHDVMDDHEMSFTVALCENEESANAGYSNLCLLNLGYIV